MKLQGKIKTILFKGERVSVLLEDARVFTDAQKWEVYTDITLVKEGKYKKGETWLSSFNEPIYQACRELGKGAEVEVGVVVSERGFKNIQSISLKLPEVDVNKDLEPPDEPPPEEATPPDEETPSERVQPRGPKRLKPDIDVSIAVDEQSLLIIRQTCIKAAGASQIAVKPEEIVEIAKRLETYVLTGK